MTDKLSSILSVVADPVNIGPDLQPYLVIPARVPGAKGGGMGDDHLTIIQGFTIPLWTLFTKRITFCSTKTLFAFIIDKF